MRKPSLLIATACLTVLIVFLPPSNKAWLYKWESFLDSESLPAVTQDVSDEEESDFKSDSKVDTSKLTKPNKVQPAFSRSEKIQPIALAVYSQKKKPYLRLKEIEERLPVKARVDKKDGEIFLTYEQTTFRMLRDVPVLEINGIFIPMESPPVLADGEVWLPVSIVQQVFRQQISVSGNQAFWKENPAAVPAFAEKKNVSAFSVHQMSDYLSFLKTPIQGAHVSTRMSHLPGAPRTYRNGVHEGIDWYSYGTGVQISKKTPVISMADGIVVRADHDYKEMTVSERQRLLARGRDNNGQTPAYILDKLRGRSVWVQYDKGVLARYVHLDRISKEVKVGQKVKTGQLIGYVGNSGTSDGAKGNNRGLHLHLDILIYGDWFWKNYSMAERREILEQVF
ncbi:peptidoglycan DD-metalloendopeptidase family protein [Paenactinomyces guangxiensis]|uniref:Peptidoglycan DD-metalloendopeptidase family protein n=1 Tax=Paenactinomyces guangxiensis TaxID=1490290 RepID=A0A7W1WQN9_9BACL|nr:peptidoglycan DD-metalloendopeptidase family protein [Paenactinomyces guangxiensis]MBA4494307.1 peptidoglycan DD-metalloendopeptidase family protein [Paenactinomyces guangxiensis]MBH8590801.1 peptidoglycan DD-metalloendopeptidase family protein [Paenactinomyces guangxiensis]